MEIINRDVGPKVQARMEITHFRILIALHSMDTTYRLAYALPKLRESPRPRKPANSDISSSPGQKLRPRHVTSYQSHFCNYRKFFAKKSNKYDHILPRINSNVDSMVTFMASSRRLQRDVLEKNSARPRVCVPQSFYPGGITDELCMDSDGSFRTTYLECSGGNKEIFNPWGKVISKKPTIVKIKTKGDDIYQMEVPYNEKPEIHKLLKRLDSRTN